MYALMDAPPDDTPAPPRPWWRKPVVWIGFVISGLAVGIFFVKFDMGEVRTSLARADGWAMAFAALVFLASYLVRGLRWKLLLHPLKVLPWSRVRDVLMVGFMLNCTLPARAGEIARPLLLWKLCGTSRRGGLATVGVERIFDGFCLVGMLSAVALVFEVPSGIRDAGYVVTAVMTAGLAIVLWLAFHHTSAFAAADRALFFLPQHARERVLGFFERFVAGTGALRQPRLVLGVGLTTLCIWCMEVVVYLTVMRGFGIELPVWCSVIVMAAVNFSIAVPSAPAYIGVYEAGCGGAVVALSRLLAYPMTWEQALSYAIGLHLLVVAVIIGAGLVLMWRLGLSLGDLTSKSRGSKGSTASES